MPKRTVRSTFDSILDQSGKSIKTGLKFPYVDSDRDGRPNITDCSPFNPLKKETFLKSTGMHIRLAVIVPSTKNVTQPISPQEHIRRVRGVEDFMRNTFGGTTRVVGYGTWKDDGRVVKEGAVMVESFTDKDEYKKYKKKLFTYIKRKKRDWGQKSISFVYEDLQEHAKKEGMHFI